MATTIIVFRFVPVGTVVETFVPLVWPLFLQLVTAVYSVVIGAMPTPLIYVLLYHPTLETKKVFLFFIFSLSPFRTVVLRVIRLL